METVELYQPSSPTHIRQWQPGWQTQTAHSADWGASQLNGWHPVLAHTCAGVEWRLLYAVCYTIVGPPAAVHTVALLDCCNCRSSYICYMHALTLLRNTCLGNFY
jgi:hypothetical protein